MLAYTHDFPVARLVVELIRSHLTLKLMKYPLWLLMKKTTTLMLAVMALLSACDNNPPPPTSEANVSINEWFDERYEEELQFRQ